MTQKIRLAIFFIFLFINFAFAEANSQVNMQPVLKEDRLEVSPYTWDLGQVKKNQVIKRIFSLKNESQKALNITGINASCACTVSEVKNKSLLPGQTTEVAIRFDSRGYSPGPIQQHVYIHTDDEADPVLKFTVKVEVTK
jgi:hypothetical protein